MAALPIEGGMDIGEGSVGAVYRALRYGAGIVVFNRVRPRRLAAAALLGALLAPMAAQAAPIAVMAFGDSLFAGYGVQDADNIPTRLEKALKADGKDVKVINASISGDTTADGVARLDWSLADKPDLVLLELGANDALRGLDPDRAKENLDAILAKLKAKNIPVVLFGMIAPRNLGPAYGEKFDPIYKELADKYQVPLYPFILDGVALDPTLNQADGMHPNKDGVQVIVKRILPVVEKALPTQAEQPQVDQAQPNRAALPR
jgi:acyl-CoA thioesterase-1